MASHDEMHDLTGLVSLLLVWACLLGGIFVLCSKISRKKRSHLPPAPPGWRPVVGHMPLLGVLPHQALAELAKRHAPNLMSLQLGSVLAIVASSPEAAQLLLQTHDQAFAGRPKTAASVHMAFDCCNIAFSPPKAYWRRMRQICATELLSNKRIHSFQSIRVNSVRSLMSAAFAQQGQVMQLRPYLLASSLDAISRMSIGRPLSEVSPEAPEVISEEFRLAGLFNLGDFIPWLACLDLQGYERSQKLAGNRWSSLLQEVLDLRRSGLDRKSEAAGEAPFVDLLDLLLSASDLTDNSIKAVIGDMFLGGSETTSVAVEWALAELIANPAAMTTLRAELDKEVGRRRLVQEEDLQGLPYLQAVVKEVMRLHPVAPLLVPHEAVEACEVSGYLIPPKARVLVNVWAIGRDPSVWDDPLHFQPERFMPEGKYHHVNVQGQHFQLLPFGSGRRKCPGLMLGLVSVQMVIASLVQAFEWALPATTQSSTYSSGVDLAEEFGLTVTMASPLTLIPTPRLQASLYDIKEELYNQS